MHQVIRFAHWDAPVVAPLMQALCFTRSIILNRLIFIILIASIIIIACGKPYGDGVGTYHKEGSQTDYTILKPNGTYEYFENGKVTEGTYYVNFNTLILNLPNGKTASGKLNSDHILDNELQKWILQK